MMGFGFIMKTIQELNEIYGKWYDGNVINRRAVIDGELVNIDSNLEICPEGWRVPLPSDISELGQLSWLRGWK